MDFNQEAQKYGATFASSAPQQNDFSSLAQKYGATFSPESQPQAPIISPSQPHPSSGQIINSDSPAGKFFGGISQDYANAIPNFLQAAQSSKLSNPIAAVGEGALRATASGLDTVFSPISRTVGALTDMISNSKPMQTALSSDLVNNTGLGKFLDSIGQAHQAFQDFQSKNPEIAKDINAGLTVALSATGEKPITKELPTEVGNIASDVSSLAQKVLPEAKAPVLDENSILNQYNRAIKPSVSGKQTFNQIQQSNSRIISGVKAISDNKNGLEFTDQNGDITKGQAPQSVDQLSQAIQQTKANIYKQYDALAKQAGEKGVSVDSSLIAKELDPVINDKALSLANPKAIAYAKDLQSRLNEVGSLDAKTAQDVIQHYNNSLKAFYRNPNYDTASQAGIDSMIANKFREQLDKGISDSTGSQYQDLKNQYGALSSMEKDVARRNIVWGRQNNVSLVDNLSSIASGVELVRGLAHLDPTSLAVSGTIKGVQKYLRYLNNPDVGVKKIFSQIEKSNPSSIENTSGSAIEKIKSSSYPDNTSFVPKSQVGKAIQSAVETYKQIPNKEGGFVNIGGLTTREIPEATKKEMIQAIDYLRLGKTSPGIENTVSRLAQKYNINEDWSNSRMANSFEDLIEKTKTSQAAVRSVKIKK